MILGFDPGLASTGFCVLDKKKGKVIDSGVIKTEPKDERETRLFLLRNSVRAILQAYHSEDPHVAIEDFIFQKRLKKDGHEVPLKSAEVLNRVVQVIVSVTWELGLDVFLYSAPTIKDAIAGWRLADKRMVGAAVSLRLGESTPSNNHAIDACAVALYHADLMLRQSRVRR